MRWIGVVVCFLGLLFPVADASAGVVSNFFTDLDDGESTVPAGWTASITGAASRTGKDLSAGGGAITYRRAIAAEVAASIEARVSANGIGAMMAMTLGDFVNDEHIRAEARLEVSGGFKVFLYDAYDATPKGQVDLDWTLADPDLRIRLKRQDIGGVPHVVLQGEASKTGPGGSPLQWDDPADPNPSPDTATSIKVPISNFVPQSVSFDEVEFGNAAPGVYHSFWAYVLVTEADDATTELPYWPPVPPAPTLVHDDKGMGNPQGVDLSADLITSGYLTNDSAVAELDADGTTYSGDVRVDPGVEVWDFDDLGDDQTVFGRVVASEASGRSRTGADGTAVIPSRSIGVPVLPGWGLIVLLILLAGSGLYVLGRQRSARSA